jgi:hypothetical protein
MKCFMALGMLVLMTSASLADTNGSRFKIEDERSLSHCVFCDMPQTRSPRTRSEALPMLRVQGRQQR